MNIAVSNKMHRDKGGLVTPAEFSKLQEIGAAFSNLAGKLWAPSGNPAYELIEAVSFAIEGLELACINQVYIKAVLMMPDKKEKIDLPGCWDGCAGIVTFPDLYIKPKESAVTTAATLDDVPLAILRAITIILKQKKDLVEKQMIVYRRIITDLVGLVLDEEHIASKSHQVS